MPRRFIPPRIAVYPQEQALSAPALVVGPGAAFGVPVEEHRGEREREGGREGEREREREGGERERKGKGNMVLRSSSRKKERACEGGARGAVIEGNVKKGSVHDTFLITINATVQGEPR